MNSYFVTFVPVPEKSGKRVPPLKCKYGTKKNRATLTGYRDRMAERQVISDKLQVVSDFGQRSDH